MTTKAGRNRNRQQEQSVPRVVGHTTERTIEQNEEFVRGIQLTLISVIKGAALAFLAANVKTAIENERIGLEFFPILITFLVICTFWYSALAGVTYLRWEFSLFDTVLYFVLGLTENVMVQFTSNTSWWVFFTGVFAILAGCTYWSDARQIKGTVTEYKRRAAERRIRGVAAAIAGALNILAVYITPQYLTWVYVLDLLVIFYLLYSVRRGAKLDHTLSRES
ncbi:MAG TPA: hypothetical protein VGD31_16190 [Sphingobacteriaceae bacterium]